MTSQKDNLHKAAQDFSLLDQCFPRHHQHTEAGHGRIMGWTTTTRYPEYEDQYHDQFQNQTSHYLRPLRPPALTVFLAPVIAINSSSDHIMKSTDHVCEVPHVTRANHANQVPFKTKDEVFSGRRNSYQVPPAAARTNKSNFGGWLFHQG
ncbi:hypothetical protein SLA2020_508400 [Shorea laevis]